jgi:site-specific recombinase XerD
MTYLAAISTPTIFDSLDISENTRKDYLARLPQFVGWLKTNGIDHDTLLRYKQHLRSRTDLGVASKNKQLAVARIAVKELYRRGQISVDLSLNVKSFRQSQKHRVEGLNEQEVEKLCQHLRELPDTFKTVRLRAIVALLLYQGLRQIEICRLDVEDVSLSTSRLNVLGKGMDDKTYICLHPQTVTALRTYLKASKIKDGALFNSLWGQSRGRRLSTRGLRGIVKDLFAEVGIDKTVHGCRHYFTTTLVKAYQSDLLRVAHYTRHRSIEMLQIYNDDLLDAADLKRYYLTFSKHKLNTV